MIRMNAAQRSSLHGLTAKWKGEIELAWVPEPGYITVRRVADDGLWRISMNGKTEKLR